MKRKRLAATWLCAMMALIFTGCSNSAALEDRVSAANESGKEETAAPVEKTGAAYKSGETEGLKDGEYEASVSLEGGSGKASIKSPAKICIKDGLATAEIIFESPYYDFMTAQGERILPGEGEKGCSTFTIPIEGFDKKISVTADTTAMSKPHEIDYTLYFDSKTLRLINDEAAENGAELADPEPGLSGSQPDNPLSLGAKEDEPVPEALWEGLSGVEKTGSLELKYAEGFSIDYYGEDYSLITIDGADRFLIASEGAEPVEVPEDVVLLKLPLSHIYAASSSVMDFFAKLNALDMVSMTSTKASDWNQGPIRDRVLDDRIAYIGKYSAPDYERLIKEGCMLAIENTMIYHNPEAKELLLKIGIPVMVERSSYERHPLGRMEWIKLYGCLMDKEDEAAAYFDASVSKLNEILPEKSSGKSTAFFYFTAGGNASVAKPKGYVAEMIELAGGVYAFDSLFSKEDNAASSMNISLEDFYLNGKDADILIYNGTVDGGIASMDELLMKNELLCDFKAVKEGNVFCTDRDLFKEPSMAAEMTAELTGIMEGGDGGRFFHRLK